MNHSLKIKIAVLISLILVITSAVFLNIKSKKEVMSKIGKSEVTNTPTNTEKEPKNLCFYRSDKTERGIYDRAWLRLNIVGDKITGEFQNLPSESDSKVGTFEGPMGKLNQQNMSIDTTVWWNSRAEGMEVKEELALEWGDGSATVGFGEMIDRGDGVYVYKDKTKIHYIKAMDQVDCETLDEKLMVEEYVMKNMGTIATNNAILGGNWYAILVVANPSLKNGEVIYEDGHIQSKANFSYEYDTSSKKTTITKFEVIKEKL